MTFDDQLKRSFDTMSERLRAAIERQADLVVEEIAAAARADREDAVSHVRNHAARQAAGEREAAVAAARQEAHAEGVAAGSEHGRREGLEEGRRQGFEQGRVQGFEEGRQRGVLDGRDAAERDCREMLDGAVAAARAERAVDAAATERLSRAVRAIGGARSLTEILETLVACAAQEAGQAGVWLVQGGHLRHWRPSGVDPGEPTLPLDDPGVIAEAARTNAVHSSDDTLAVPVAMAGQVVAVLFTNPGTAGGAIEIMARYAARCLEAVTAFKAARALTERPGGTDATAAAVAAL